MSFLYYYSTYTSLGLLPLLGHTTHNSSNISSTFAARAYHNHNFLCIREVLHFFDSFTIAMAFSIISGSSSCSHL
ncbi:MAG: hypothetical protein Q8S84_03785 [bacterium]|nr:hypothetical protein [bacterium]MDP3380642.1 hypothetical protein [bacterium]